MISNKLCIWGEKNVIIKKTPLRQWLLIWTYTGRDGKG